jgi:hypothetical protein
MIITTTLAPMRRGEVGRHLQGEQDLDLYPDNMLFVQRRHEVFAGADRMKDRVGWEKAQVRLQELMGSHVANAPSDIEEYVSEILGSRQA